MLDYKIHLGGAFILTPCLYKDIQHYRYRLRRENVFIGPCKKEHWWFMLEPPGEGFCGLMRFSADEARLRSRWINKKFRGNGLGREMTIAMVALAKDKGFSRVHAYTVHPRNYDDLGFERVKMISPVDAAKDRPHGLWLVRKALLDLAKPG